MTVLPADVSRGLTALDDLDENTLGTRPNMSHVTAREEVMGLVQALKLPLDRIQLFDKASGDALPASPVTA